MMCSWCRTLITRNENSIMGSLCDDADNCFVLHLHCHTEIIRIAFLERNAIEQHINELSKRMDKELARKIFTEQFPERDFDKWYTRHDNDGKDYPCCTDNDPVHDNGIVHDLKNNPQFKQD